MAAKSITRNAAKSGVDRLADGAERASVKTTLKHLVFAFGLLCGVVPIPAISAGMGWDDARHLLARTGFGPTVAEIREFLGLSRSEAVERLLAGARSEASNPPPAWVDEPIPSMRAFREGGPEARRSFMEREIRRGLELRGWWVAEMLETPSPLTERMTLFWHGHFTSSQQKVRLVQLMYRQNALLRRHALGSFAELLHAVSKDPAMIIYLDSATNRKGRPNENFAREVMELFTLGEGRYSESDVREAARAFTGWSIDPDNGEFRWRPLLHDGGEKTVLGKRGPFGGGDVLDILLAQTASAEHIVAKLWREFISTRPEQGEVQRIARRFRDSRYEIKVALREVLNSRPFWAPENRGALIKSPAEFVVGTLRTFQIGVADPVPFALLAGNLGQNLFSPPNVRGWPGGEAWINSATLLGRKQFVERLFRAEEMPRPAMDARGSGASNAETSDANGVSSIFAQGRQKVARALFETRFDSFNWLAQFPRSWFGDAEAVRRALLPLEPVNDLPPRAKDRELIRSLVLDPVYQLK